MFKIDQQPWLEAIVCLIDEHCALAQQGLEAFEYQVDHRVEQRMAGREQLRLRLAGDQRLLEGDARIAIEYRIAAPDQPVAFLEDARHASDFEAARLALGDPTAQQAESLAEERADEVRLEAPGLRRSISSRIAATVFGSMPSEVSLRSATKLLDRADIDGAVDLAEQLGLNVSGWSP